MAELPPATFVTAEKRNRKMDEGSKDVKRWLRSQNRKRERPPPPAPESASAPAPYRHSFGPELPDVSSHQEIHHRLIAHFHGKQLRDLHVSASARFPARHLPHLFPEYFLLVFPPAAVAEEVLPRLGHYPLAPPASVVLSVTESF